MENWALKLGHPKFESWAFKAVFHFGVDSIKYKFLVGECGKLVGS